MVADMLTKRRVFEILEKGRVDDRQSLYCDLFLSALIIVNLIAICLETIDSLLLSISITTKSKIMPQAILKAVNEMTRNTSHRNTRGGASAP